MHRAAILALEGCHASSLGGVADVLQVANAHLRRQQGEAGARFEWHFVSLDGQPIKLSNGLRIETRRIEPREAFAVVFVPSLHYPGHRAFDRMLRQQAPACAWLRAQWEGGALLAANCTGTFILAGTGLLDARVATTTWWLEAQFRSRFPQVDLRMQPLITEADRLLCAGASASYLLQAIRVIERFAGPLVASQCAKTMLIDVSQTEQTPYLPLLSQQEHADALVHSAAHWLQRHMRQEVRVSALAREMGVSERTLIRRFQSALGQSPLAYLQSLRIESARGLLEGAGMSVERVAAQVGYQDTSSFSRLFRQRVGLSPGAYRARFQSAARQAQGGRLGPSRLAPQPGDIAS